MPIAALSSNTVQVIGSSQVLTDSTAVVKELVDNALDGRATAIFVEVSTNTLDVIQVKDNGHGITPEDRSMLGRRYCTSKIRDLEDLANVGGQSLGFRGEALASAAEMSGSMMIITRVEGEPAATSIKVKRQGGIERHGHSRTHYVWMLMPSSSEKKTSHPVGTTIRVVDFLKSIPVRRQTALKAPSKLMFKIKNMIQAYALARPTVRFSLKVVKAQNDKGNWMYAPTNGLISEVVMTNAAMQVVGRKTVEQSRWTVWSSLSVGEQTGNATDDVYTIEALLPAPVCDPSSFNNSGHFVSIDSRPVSCARGVLKQTISLFKSYLRSANSSSNGQNVVNPFLYMNITCPQRSYDVNIEPAKDDVLFTSNNLFLGVMESFFKQFYGELKVQKTKYFRAKLAKPGSHGFELLLARKPPLRETAPQKQDIKKNNTLRHHEDVSCTAELNVNSANSPSSVRCPETSSAFETSLGDDRGSFNGPLRVMERRPWKRNMYIIGDDVVNDSELRRDEYNQSPVRSGNDDDDDLRNVAISNPWAFAKMNASVRPSRRAQEAETATSTNGQLYTPVRQKGEASDDPNSSDKHDQLRYTSRRELPSPESSHLNFSATPAPHSSSPEPFPYPLKAWGKDEHSRTAKKPPVLDRKCYGSGALDTWVQKSLDNHTHIPRRDQVDVLEVDSVPAKIPRDFVSARNLPIGTPLSNIPEAATRSIQNSGPRKQHQQPGIKEPFLSPLSDPERVWFETEPKRKSKVSRTARPENGIDIVSIRGSNHPSDKGCYSIPDVPSSAASADHMYPNRESIMDYELRKQAALENRKKYVRQRAASATKSLDQNFIEIPSLSQASQTSPHENRYNKAIAALRTFPPDRQPALEPTDPRAYLIRTQQRDNVERQTDPTGASLIKKRTKTAMLPLESIKEDQCTRDLVLRVKVTAEEIREKVQQAAVSDIYTTSGKLGAGFSALTKDQAGVWEGKLRRLLMVQYRNEREAEEEGTEVSMDLQTAVRVHLEMYG